MANSQCMASFGLPSIPTVLSGFDDTSLRDLRMHTKLYGFFDPAAVSTKGYDMFRAPSDTASGVRVKLSDQAIGVEYGRDAAGKLVKSFDGKPVPTGGCKAKGVEASGGILPSLDPASLPDGGPTVPYGDPRVTAANAAWSSCMTSKGYHFTNPFDAALAVTANPPKSVNEISHSAAEISQAGADIQCKISTNLIGIDFAVQVAYDEKYIEDHAVALTQYQSQLNNRIRDASQIIAAGGVQ